MKDFEGVVLKSESGTKFWYDRKGFQFTVTASQAAYISGGQNTFTLQVLDEVERVDLVHKTTKVFAHLSDPRIDHSVNETSERDLLFIGGKNWNFEALKSIELISGENGESLKKFSLKFARSSHSVIELSATTFLVVGGYGWRGFVKEIELVDIERANSTVVAYLTEGRAHSTLAWTGENLLSVSGGDSYGDSYGGDIASSVETVSIAASATSTQVQNQFLPSTELRTEGQTVFLSDRLTLQIGGVGNNAKFISSIRETDILSGVSTEKSSLITPRKNFVAKVLHGKKKVLIFGGVDQSGKPVKSIELYDSETAVTKQIASIDYNLLSPVFSLSQDEKEIFVMGEKKFGVDAKGTMLYHTVVESVTLP